MYMQIMHISFCGVPSTLLKVKLGVVQSGSADIDPKKATAILPARGPLLAVLVRGAGDEQLGTHKFNAGDVVGRQDDSA